MGDMIQAVVVTPEPIQAIVETPAQAAQATIDANNKVITDKWAELQQQQQEQAKVQRAQAEAGIYQTLGLSKFGRAADNELGFMQQWQQVTDDRALASAAGEIPQQTQTNGFLYSDSGNNHWDVVSNGFGNTKDKDDQTPGV